jgi:hypothetical protein
MTNPAAETAPATLATDIETAVRRAIEAAVADSEHVVGYRVVQAGHLVVWLDLEAGKRARFAVWDGSTLVAPLTLSRQTRTRAGLRALKVHASASLVQDWTEVA